MNQIMEINLKKEYLENQIMEINLKKEYNY